MKLVILFYPPSTLIARTEVWPPLEDQKKVKFVGVAAIQQVVLPSPQGPMPAIQVRGLGDWNLRYESWADDREPTEDERRAYEQWRAEQAGIQVAHDPVIGRPGGPGPLRRVR